MAVRKITEQQFRTRRKDRKMVWVDAAATVVGLLILTMSVGGVIVLDPPAEPFEYNYSFFETKFGEKHCIGDATVTSQGGCTHYPAGTEEELPEGEPMHNAFTEVTSPNITQVSIRLSFIDEFEESDADKTYWYDVNSTDTLRLNVTTPWGEIVSKEATNDLKLKSGEILAQFNFTPLPEAGTYPAFDEKAVYDAIVPQHTAEDPVHPDTGNSPLGTWSYEVLVVRAGDQEGSVPADACEVASNTTGQPVTVPDPTVAEECRIDDQQRTFEGTTPGRTVTSTGRYHTYVEDEGNGWLLEFTVRAYDVTVSF